MFTEDQMGAWENMTAVQQTWQNLQDYFTENWLECRQYLQAMQELAAAEEEGNTSAIMFTLLQEQHKVQLELTAASNKQVMDMMFKHMNALITGHGKAADKVNAPPGNSNKGCTSGSMKRNRKKCTNCKKHVFHKPEDCYKLETNANKHWAG